MVVIVGIHAFMKMQRTEDPTITIRTGIVAAAYPGATSEQVEKQVTKTLEKHIFKFPEVRKEKTYSTSRPGIVIINVELEDNVKNSDQFWAKLRHEMNLTRATELPAGVQGPVVDSDFGDTVAMLIAVHGKRYGYRELRDFADKIHDEMRTVRLVGKLVTYGTQSEEIRITSSLERMAQYFADPRQVANALMQRNVIQSAGHFEGPQSKIPIRTTGIFNTENEVRNVLVDVSKDGHPVYIKDFADVERRYQDPAFMVRYDGEPCLLLSVEMQKGKNIVELGQQLDTVFQRLKVLLPPDVQIDMVANQPEVVKERIASLSHEFLIAIIAVIVVIILLLPVRVALIAALAIPISLCGTLGAMEAMGLALHQVSIAGLIVVLGIVVDNAIVVIDNYVELLDQKVPRPDAAWRSASDVFVPVLAATITIIASFLPLLIITGSVGEFVMALPITVAIALAVSFIVAAFITPLLCNFFIKKGLHDHDATESQGKKKGLLDRLQDKYGILITMFMKRKGLAFTLGIAAVVVGVMLFVFVPQQFFPSAERNQFVIDVWMPQGTRIEATDAVMGRIEKALSSRKGVEHYATFVGQSAPRFYYNVNPQQPDGAYGQFIVNTASVKDTSRLVKELRPALAQLAPNAMVIVEELQQGSQMEAPVEVRIAGDDIGELKQLGEKVQGILEDVSFSQFVFRDYLNDSYRVDVKVNDELANRLGITDASVAQTLSGAFDGAPVDTFWEGDRAVAIKLRLDPASRSSFTNIGNTYVESELTRARVPLRAVAQLAPEWQTSRIVRRNGVPTLTIRAFVKPGYYASQLLEKAMPRLKALELPAGYRIYYGGEKNNQDEVFPQMIAALGISLLAIFLVLLVQFRTISEPLVVMAAIPLTLFGAMLGLVVTGNPFGFTSFMGVISLCGIVVRNGIILVDYCNERIAAGVGLEDAAKEAGARRLRPIFLTSMAAAMGMVPMILSGSSLWSPLASVMSFGLVFSMVFTLLVIPVLFAVIKSRSKKRASLASATATVAIALCVLVGAGREASAETMKYSLTLPQAVELALKQNSLLKIGRAKVTESDQKIVSARSQYYPQLSNNSKFVALSDTNFINVPAGSLGNVPGVGPFPTQNVSINQGSNPFFLSETTLAQPTTQLFKIHEANEIARADRGIAEAELKRSEDETVFAAHQLYYALLVACKEKDAADALLTAAQENLREAEEGVRAGNLLDVAVTAARANLLQSRQALIVAETRISDVTSELNDLLGLPSDELLEVTEVGLPMVTEPLKEQAYDQARAGNGELRAARAALEKSRHAVKAAKYEYIPDVTLFARHVYQHNAAFLKNNIGVIGAELTWNIFDWGKRKGEVGQRVAQQSQAEENLARIDKRIVIEIDKVYRKLERSKKMVDVARQALSLWKEKMRLSENGLKAGTVTVANHAETVAALKKVEMEELQASLEYRLAITELDKTIGLLSSSKN
jgi:multidrug efflux pump subunit AcrB/outer membrane protein TolC